jgi:CRISPR/Cas system-associated protein Csm6
MLFTDNIHAKLDAFITDKDSRACDELAHFMLALSTKRAEQSSLISIIFFCHFTAPALGRLGGLGADQSV